MKKIIILFFMLLFFIPGVNGFTISEFESKKIYYKQLIEKKISYKLDMFTKVRLNKLQKKVEDLIKKIDTNDGFSDDKKLVKLSLLYAFKDILSEKITDYKEGIIVTVIDDKRCSSCQTSSIVAQLKSLPELKGVIFKIKDFSDESAKELLEINNIKVLPVIIFNTNLVNAGINPYLTPVTSGGYSLQLGSTFDPFQERSEKGFLMLSLEKIQEVKAESYIKGNKDAKITWLEYSDLECPYCAKLHNSGTPEELIEKYGDDLNIIFNHFPLSFHKNAQIGAEILECVGSEKGSEAFYSLMEKSFEEQNSSKEFLTTEAIALGVNEIEINRCINSGDYSDKVLNQMNVGNTVFEVTGTPGNVIINNETGEYEIISGAYPTASFENIIDSLLK